MERESHDFAPSEQLIEIAEEFVDRLRRHDDPTVDEYAQRFPNAAEEIHRYLPLLVPSDPSRSDNEQCGELPIPNDLLPIGISRYHIKELIGSGSMGAVYLAHDLELDRSVAFKMPQLQNGHVAERFYREARAMATVDHPNICSIYDVGEIRADDVDCEALSGLIGRPFMTMAYVAGRDLSSLMTEPWDALDAAQLVYKIAQALEVAHQAGVVHRDIKPRNIIVKQQMEPVVTDFGLARRQLPEEVELTIDGQIIGSPAYMSPEQINGRLELGPPADVYSLGIMLYELVCGLRPFSGAPLTMLRDICWKEPPSPRRHRPELDADIESICMKAIAKSPADRYTSAAELAGDLRAYLDGQHVAKPLRTKRVYRRAMIATAVVCSLGMAMLWWHQQRETSSAAETGQTLLATGMQPRAMISHVEFSRQLDAIFLDHFKYRRHGSREPNMSAAYRQLYAQYGISSEWTSPKALEVFLGRRPDGERNDILVGLESWLLCALREVEDVPVPWLESVLEHNHPDHTPIRRALIELDKTRGSLLARRFAVRYYDARLPVVWSFYLRRFDRHTARKLLVESHEAYPDSRWVNAAFGLRKKDNANHNGAIAHFEDVVEESPSAAIYTQLGISYLAAERRQDAIVALRKALDLEFEYGMAHFALGKAYFLEREISKARTELLYAIEQQCSALGQAYRYYARVLMYEGEHEQAVAAAMEAVRHMRDGRNWRNIVRLTTVLLKDLEASQEERFVGHRLQLVGALFTAARESRQLHRVRPFARRLLADIESLPSPDADSIARLQKIIAQSAKAKGPK